MKGALSKMQVSSGHQVQYALTLGDQVQPMNALIGKVIQLVFLGNIHCQACGRLTNKSFSQGYCYPCFQTLAECDLCVMSPERCHHHLGTCRDNDFAARFCMQTHHVYLANTSGLKVGITRRENLPTRWLDQGATQAVVIMNTASRRAAGLIEHALKAHVSDRTSWQRMLKGPGEPIDLLAARDDLVSRIQEETTAVQEELGIQAVQPVFDGDVHEFEYPVSIYPEKVKSHNLDKAPVLEGTLMGIKAQYLILDTAVINLRKYTAYQMSLSWRD